MGVLYKNGCIGARFLKKVARVVSPYLKTAFNECKFEGVFPQILKIAKNQILKMDKTICLSLDFLNGQFYNGAIYLKKFRK